MQVEKLQKTLVFIIGICNFLHLLRFLYQFSTESYARRKASKDYSIYRKRVNKKRCIIIQLVLSLYVAFYVHI